MFFLLPLYNGRFFIIFFLREEFFIGEIFYNFKNYTPTVFMGR
jgi:hypothetical protein